ncbi:MAG: CRTAC1 family protein [Rhodothermales bacterium]
MEMHIASLTALLCMLILFGRAGCGSPPESPTQAAAPSRPWFEDVARPSGIAFDHVRAVQPRFLFPEIMSGGAAWIDYDRDGDLDLYLVQGGEPDAARPRGPGNRLFRNDGAAGFADVTTEAGVGDTGYGMGAAVGDYDGDGDDDLYVTNVGPNVLYRNEGDGRFTDATAEAGVGHPGWGASAAFVDYDEDGRLDLYVVNYIHWSTGQELECASGGAGRDYCHPENYRAPATDVLYRNIGKGRFEDATPASGIGTVAANGLGVAPGDFNDDGRIDFYVANDGNPNQLWINQGDGTFVDRALRAGAAVNRQGMSEAGMGVVAVDIEADGDLDLFVTHLRDESNTLYRNDGGFFEDVSVSTGLASPSLPYTGFGLAMGDFDRDGWLDLFVGNGRVGRAGAVGREDPFAEPNQLFRGIGPGRFEELQPEGGVAPPLVATTRAVAMADYDNDGDLDLAIVNNQGPFHLLRNVTAPAGNWVGFDVRRADGQPAIGARVRVQAGGVARWRLVQRAGSYQASNDPRVLFGLGASTAIDSVSVLWPDGHREPFPPPVLGAYTVLREGTR